jgi:hypothetical protein
MESNKFFKYLWRVNAVFIFFIAIFAAVGAFNIAFWMIAELRSDETRPPTAEIAIGDTSESENNLRIQIPYRPQIVGNYTYFELRAGEDSHGKFSSYNKSQLRNVAVYDLISNSTKWVFQNSNQEIEAFMPVEIVTRDESKKSTQQTKAFLLKVATSKTDKSIVKDLWIMPPNGKSVRKILSNISGKLDLHRLGDNEFRIIVETKGSIDIYPLDVTNLSIGKPSTVTLQ